MVKLSTLHCSMAVLRAALLALALPAVGGSAFGPIAAQASGAPADRCFPDWSDAAPIVQREQLTSTKDLLQHVRAQQRGDLVRITLCEQQGRYVYRLVILEAKGRLTNMTVDAKRPF
jgi:hypothetical protein